MSDATRLSSAFPSSASTSRTPASPSMRSRHSLTGRVVAATEEIADTIALTPSRASASPLTSAHICSAAAIPLRPVYRPVLGTGAACPGSAGAANGALPGLPGVTLSSLRTAARAWPSKSVLPPSRASARAARIPAVPAYRSSQIGVPGAVYSRQVIPPSTAIPADVTQRSAAMAASEA